MTSVWHPALPDVIQVLDTWTTLIPYKVGGLVQKLSLVCWLDIISFHGYTATLLSCSDGFT